MESIWTKSTEIPRREALSGDRSADVAVIGGGLAGILTAYLLGLEGAEAIVLEASTIGSGQTKNTTAKITSQHGMIYHKLIADCGLEKARQYADANQRAIARYRSIIEEEGIGCGFEERPAYLYSRQQAESLRREAEAAKQVGIAARFTRETSLPFDVAGAVRFDGQAQFHPLSFLKAVSQSVTVYEHTAAQAVNGTVIETGHGRVNARHIVFATHYPFVNVPGYYFMRMHQERSYVLALQNAQEVDGMYLGVDSDGYSFRNYGELLLLGGGGHRTGENLQGGKYETLRQAARRYYPSCREVACWSAQDCVSLDSIPYIGRYSAATPNWYVATGFKKWGMTTSMAGATILSDLILGRENAFAEVFSPGRFDLSASAKTLFEDSVQAAKGLAKTALHFPREAADALGRGHGGIVEYRGEKMGVYKDEMGEVFAVSAVCPHLKCALTWNPDEKSWDCPCHGSRFDYRGNLIDNPAQQDLRT